MNTKKAEAVTPRLTIAEQLKRIEQGIFTPCPNCGQWRYIIDRGYKDCMNECAFRGLAPKIKPCGCPMLHANDLIKP